MDIGGRIRAARKKLGLTQAEVAKQAEIAVNTLRLYEANKRQPKIEYLQRIARVLNVPEEQLLDLPDYMQRLVDEQERTIKELLDEILQDESNSETYRILDAAKSAADSTLIDRTSELTGTALRDMLFYSFSSLNKLGKIHAILFIQDLLKSPRFQR